MCPRRSFIVIGSRGNHYTVKLQDGLHSCECMDWRFRRHHCKHICLVLSQLGILDQPTQWREVGRCRAGGSAPVCTIPLGTCFDALPRQQQQQQQQQQRMHPTPCALPPRSGMCRR